MTDFRALCAELLSAMDTLYKQSVTTSYSQTIEINGIRHAIPIGKDILAQDAVYADLLDRTRAALDQPEPQEPTDEDVLRCLADVADECILIDHPKDVVAAGRQLLARWGRPTSEENLNG